MALSRYTTFTAGSTLAAADLEAELDNLVDALNGTDSVDITMTSGAAATLTVNNTGSAKPQSWQIGGVEKLFVNATGQLESSIATGTAPFKVASTTQVSNLSAEFIGTITASNVVRKDQANTITVNGGWNELQFESDTANQITMHDSTYDDPALDGAYFRLRQSARLWKFGVSDDDAVYDDIIRLNGATGRAQMELTFKNNDWSNLATEGYVEAKLTTLSIGAFYEGALSTGAKQVRFIVPDGIDTGTITKVKTTYQSGTVTADSVIYLRHYNSAGTEDASSPYTITIASSQSTGVATTTDITDITLAAGDQLEWEVNTASGHAEVSVWAQGTQSLI